MTVSSADDPTLLRMIIQNKGNAKVLEQIEKQLYKLVDVLCVSKLTVLTHIECEIMLVKLQATTYGHDEIKRCSDIFRGQVVNVTLTPYTFQLVGTSNKLDDFIKAVRGVAKIVEVAHSGIIDVSRGDEIIR